MTPDESLAAALRLAEKRFRVFPLNPNAKTPAVRGWQSKATSDPDMVRRLWRERGPEPYNVGVAAGDGLLALDVDVKDGRKAPEVLAAALRGLGVQHLPRTTYVGTPSGGMHLYFKAPAGVSFGNTASRLAKGVDTRGDGGYVVGPGSIVDGKPYKWGVGGSPDETPIAEIPEPLAAALAANDRQPIRAPQKVIGEPDLPRNIERARRWLADEAPEAVEGAGGDHTTFTVAARLLDFGLTQDTAFDLLLDWNETKASPPWAAEELRSKLDNAARYRRSPVGSDAVMPPDFDPIQLPGTRPALTRPSTASTRLFWCGEKPCTPQPPELVKGVLPAGEVAFLAGQSRAGKTFVAVDLAAALATGQPFFGASVRRKAGTLFVAAEGAGTMQERLDALQHGRCAFSESPALPITYTPWSSSLTNVSARADLIALASEAADRMQRDFGVRLGLIVIDTLAAAFSITDENDAAQAATAIRHMKEIHRATGALVLAVAHYGKSAETGVRGSSAFTAGADVILAVAAERGADEVATQRTVNLVKSRWRPERPLGRFWLKDVEVGKDEDGDSIRAAIVVPVETPNAGAETKRAGKNGEFVLAFHRAAAEAGPGIDPFGPMVVSEDAVRRAFAAQRGGKSADSTRKAFARALEAAQGSGAVHYTPDGLLTTGAAGDA